MGNILSITDQKVKKLYVSLSDVKPIANKKTDIRKIAEHIVNDLLLLEGIDIEKENKKDQYSRSFNEKVKLLIKKNRLDKKFRPALSFIWFEGSRSGAHGNNEPEDAGEPSYLDSMKICIREVIRQVFEIKRLDTGFLDFHDETIFLKKELEKSNQQNEDIELQYNNANLKLDKIRRRKKNTTIIFASLFGLVVMISVFYINSISSDLKTKDTNIESLTEVKNELEESIKLKNSAIDSLKGVILVAGSKEEKNFGFKNEFNGEVGSVENVQNVDSLDELD